MENPKLAQRIPPFPPGYRASGLLLHITSLPSSYGIGDLGPGAFQWVDRLHEAGQCWWQALPLGPTGYNNSPYQGLSSFVGNGLLISPDLLVEDGLLERDDCQCSFSSTAVDYDVVISFKHGLLEKVWTRFRDGARKDLIPAFEQFRHTRANWLEDYALFRALKTKFNGASYVDWPLELVKRTPAALARARQELSDRIDRVCFAQFLLFRQYHHLKEYAHSKDVRIIGDLPFFVAADSSDVWANPELFLLDEQRRPRFVAGVPPDYFSREGQRWGNPVFNWEALRCTGFHWWIERIRALLAQVDVIRLDHFRAFAGGWHIPADAATAENGHWVPGPGAEFFSAVKNKLGGVPFIAEDLGLITPEVLALRDQFELPGVRVLQFAFDGDAANLHLPHNYPANVVVYTGTHDNATTREWFEGLRDRQQRCFWEYLRLSRGEVRDAAPELIRLAWSSPAALAITPFQDLLNLGGEARMNVPGRPEGNWRWRATQNMLSAWNFRWLGDLTRISKRTGSGPFPIMEAAS